MTLLQTVSRSICGTKFHALLVTCLCSFFTNSAVSMSSALSSSESIVELTWPIFLTRADLRSCASIERLNTMIASTWRRNCSLAMRLGAVVLCLDLVREVYFGGALTSTLDFLMLVYGGGFSVEAAEVLRLLLWRNL
ncbi:hypothetical protein BDV96DRAFT_560878, partial [Lophiotrema nucula]